jgi:hypothetical protein
MNSNPLYRTSEHLAWKQRVNREIGNERKFADKADYKQLNT